jgi:predicted  nucleic acid-binding Zn-ribbon protein
MKLLLILLVAVLAVDPPKKVEVPDTPIVAVKKSVGHVQTMLKGEEKDADDAFKALKTLTLTTLTKQMTERATHDKALPPIFKRIRIIIKTMDKLDKRLVNLKVIIPKLDKKFGGLKARFEKKNSVRTAQKKAFDQATKDTMEGIKAVRDMKVKVKTLKMAVPAFVEVEAVNPTVKNVIKEMKAAISNPNIDMKLMLGLFRSFKKTLNSAQAKRAAHEERRIAFFKKSTAAISKLMEAAKKKLDDRKAEQEKKTKKYADLKTELAKLRADVKEHKKVIADLTGKIDDGMGKWERAQKFYEQDSLKRAQSTGIMDSVMKVAATAGTERELKPINCAEAKVIYNTSTDGEYRLYKDDASFMIYCQGMSTDVPTEYITLKQPTYSTYYDRRLRNGGACKSKKFRGDFKAKGLTTFTKVRIDLTTMRLIQSGFLFAKTKDNFIQLGTAGDCYSWVDNCHKGEFRVDLRGSGFKFAKKTTWSAVGVNTFVNAKMGQYVAKGKCGGWCGTCGPVDGLFVTPVITK